MMRMGMIIIVTVDNTYLSLFAKLFMYVSSSANLCRR